MAYLDKKGYLQLTDEERESLREGTGRNWADNIINWIINGE